MPYTAYNSVSKMGLAASSGAVKEQYIPLWVMSSSTAGGSSASGYIQKGSTSVNLSSSATSVKLHTLSSSWPSGQKFALEASFYAGIAAMCYVYLYDLTTVTQITSATLSTTSTTPTLLRSGSFTLTPGHSYGIELNYSQASGIYLTKAHLVAIN